MADPTTDDVTAPAGAPSRLRLYRIEDVGLHAYVERGAS